MTKPAYQPFPAFFPGPCQLIDFHGCELLGHPILPDVERFSRSCDHVRFGHCDKQWLCYKTQRVAKLQHQALEGMLNGKFFPRWMKAYDHTLKAKSNNQKIHPHTTAVFISW